MALVRVYADHYFLPPPPLCSKIWLVFQRAVRGGGRHCYQGPFCGQLRRADIAQGSICWSKTTWPPSQPPKYIYLHASFRTWPRYAHQLLSFNLPRSNFFSLFNNKRSPFSNIQTLGKLRSVTLGKRKQKKRLRRMGVGGGSDN